MREVEKNMRKITMKKRKKINHGSTKFCILCKSKNIKIIFKGLETDLYRCLDCKKRYGVTDLKRF